MKPLLILALVCTALPMAWAQGQINVANRVSILDLDAPVFDTDCATRLEGAAYLARAYVGFIPDSLSPVGPLQAFRTGTGAGYITPYTVTVPGAAGHLVYFQLRAWEARAGSSFETAVAAGGKYGFSNIIPVVAVMPPRHT